MQRILLNKDFFPDENLLTLIEYKLDVDIDTDITDLVLEIKELNLSQRFFPVENVEGIQYLQNLEKLYLYNHKIYLVNSNILAFIKSFPYLLDLIKLSRLNLEVYSFSPIGNNIIGWGKV